MVLTSLTGSFPLLVWMARVKRRSPVRPGPGRTGLLRTLLAGGRYLLAAPRWMASKEKLMVLFRPWNVLSADVGTVIRTRR